MEDDGGTFSAVRAFCDKRDDLENKIFEVLEDKINDSDGLDLLESFSPKRKTQNKRGSRKLKKQAAQPKAGKSRRNILAENLVTSDEAVNAAESTQSRPRRRCRNDVVDLIKSPPLVLPQVVSLDSDEESNPSKEANNPDVSFELENLEIKVKIKWHGKIELFVHRKHQKFQDIMKQLAEKENVSINDIYLKLNERMIKLDDTPDSIDYKTHNFIIGRVVHQINSELVGLSKKDPNEITLKIQSNMWKKPFVVKLKKTDAFKLLYIKVSEEQKLSADEITLSFDGELLNFDETPNDLELEGGEIIDCHPKKVK